MVFLWAKIHHFCEKRIVLPLFSEKAHIIYIFVLTNQRSLAEGESNLQFGRTEYQDLQSDYFFSHYKC